MTWLALGVLLWSGVHLFPSLAPARRARWIGRVGAQPYRGGFSLALLVAVGLLVLGWRSSPPLPVYAPPAWGASAADALLFPALVLFAASALPSNVKRFVRHPQLTGFGLWAGAHLLANGDRRSLLLFGGLGLWSALEIAFINRREGAWRRPAPQPLAAEAKLLLAATAAYALLFLLHPYIAGVPTLP